MIGDSFRFTIEGVEMTVTQAQHWQFVEPALKIDPKAVQFYSPGLIMPPRDWERARIAILHQLNLRNPRWLARRARMARKKRRGWA